MYKSRCTKLNYTKTYLVKISKLFFVTSNFPLPIRIPVIMIYLNDHTLLHNGRR